MDPNGGWIQDAQVQDGRVLKAMWLQHDLSDFQGVLNGNNLTAKPS